ncbi:histone deacetylase, partial [Streptomyces kasugaensis]
MNSVRSIEPGPGGGPSLGQVWYTSYGSNMYLERLACYLVGGRPPGAARGYPGCRDRGMPA